MLEIKNILKETLHHRSRLILTIVAITWGTISITLMLAIGEGLRQSFANITHANTPGVIYITPGTLGKNYHGQHKGSKVHLTLNDVRNIQNSIPHLQATLGLVQTTFPLRHHKKQLFAFSPFAVPPSFAHYKHLTIAPPGRFISNADQRNASHVIVLGNETATQLFGQRRALGQTLEVNDFPFKVIGVIKPSVQIMVNLSYDAYSSWIPRSTYRLMSQNHNITNIMAIPTSSQLGSQIQQQIIGLLASSKNLNPNDKQLFSTIDSADAAQKIITVFSGMQTFLGIVGGITLLVAGIGIANVMFASVKRSTKMIGVKMALGARRYHILFHYTLEALLITLLGGVIGIASTFGIVGLIDLIPITSQTLIKLGKPHPIISYLVVAIVVLILGIIGLVAGLLPARKAASIQPAEALRYE